MLMKIVFACLVAVILNHAWKVISLMRPSGYVHSHSPGPCHIVPGVDRGSEDLTLLKNGLVLVSSGVEEFGLVRMYDEESQPGRLLLFDFNKPNEVEELKLPDRFKNNPLYPHGVSVFQPPNSDIATLFVVNHPVEGLVLVEKFHLDLRTHKLTYLKTIQDDLFVKLNDVVAVSEDSFYATQDNGIKNRVARHLEVLLMLRLGAVYFYDGKSARTVVDGMFVANGIEMSPDGRHVYVSHTGDKTVDVYERDTKTNDLSLVQVYPLYTGGDNIIMDGAGDLWLGAHPDGMALGGHVHNVSYPAPSQVLRLKTDKGRITSMTEVYADSGKTLSASSSAVHHNGHILIGSVRHKLLLCQLKTG